MFQTILFPIDRSREAWEATGLVIHLVQQYQSRLVLLSVVADAAEESEIAAMLDKGKALFAEQGITVECLERGGNPPFAICDVADEIEADLIVMACRGLGLTSEGASESVTNRVINLAPCPVLVVP
jgi:nucleotide-binding universal stress UspA family protein